MNFHLTEKRKHALLIILLIILTLVVRLQSDHQTDFDSYWLHGMAESIQIHGSALWVFHPASLFGYYPLSYPSGTQFFLATASTLTGLDMNTTVFATALLVGVLATMLVLLVGYRLFKSWLVGYLAAFIFSLSPIIIQYTSFNASGRMFIMLFYLLFIWTLVEWYRLRKKRHLGLAVLFLLFALLTHRTSQFIIVFIVAYICAEVYMCLPKIWTFIKKHKHYRRFVHPRYEKNKYYLLLDFGIIVLILAAAKFADLIVRGRLTYNFQLRILEPLKGLVTIFQENALLAWFIFGGVLILVTAVLLALRFIWKKRVLKSFARWIHNHYHGFFINPEKYFVWLLLLIALYFFVGQFTGNSFYAPSYTDFQQSEILSGSAPWVIFINMIINYTTSVSPLFVFCLAGFLFLLFNKNKGFDEWFLVFTFIGFSGVLLDKQYTKMFIVPIIAILGSYAFLKLFADSNSTASKFFLPKSNE